MKRYGLLLVFALCAAVTTVSAQTQEHERPSGFALVIGPRIGVSYVMSTPAEYSSYVEQLYPAGSYFPVNTLFGVNLEQRILLGQTKSHFAFQEIVLIGGLEQSIALPEAAFLIGYRDFSGFELGIGPLVSLAGVGVVAALGWTLSFQGVFVPIDLSVSLPSATRVASIALTTGFNFEIRRSSPE